jgi:ferredoxin--NADP+ reductase
MPELGTADHPLRVAIVGAGPAGFYVAEHLAKRADLTVAIDLFERLPTPYGLVRFGVAPDHEKIKNVTRVYDRVAGGSHFRFFGNVDVGRDVTLDDLRRFYHQICFTTGAQTDRRMGIPGEDLDRSHAATEFVAWYNGHPDYRDRTFDLSVERVAVVGVGNVAVDVARILCRTPEELATTDIADYALDALRRSRVREVYMLGRRGPAQAAFTNPEVRELGAMPGADVVVEPDEVALDALSRAELEREPDRSTEKKIEIIQGFAQQQPSGKPKKLIIRFLVSPLEILDDGDGRVAAMRIVKNRLRAAENGSLRPEATEMTEDLPVQLVFRSVGYRGVSLDGLPFEERRGTVPNVQGRVIDPATETPVPGVYVSGWIKRGPSGVIGTNKPDAGETVGAMLEDLDRGATLSPEAPGGDAVERFVRERRPACVSYDDWKRLDALEAGRGKPQGRPRVKFTSVEEMLEALRRT